MLKNKKYPKISIIILTLNEEDYLRECLKSIRKQSYPQERIEIIVVDNGSKDNSLKVAESYGAKVFVNEKGDVYQNWAIALHKITGDFVYMVDQDIRLRGINFFQKMVNPLMEDKRIIASFTRKYPRSDQHWVTRFISYHPAQCDPLYEFLIPQVEGSFLKKKNGYILCKFELGKVPPFGRQFYRVEYFKKTSSWNMKRVFDNDSVVRAIKSGYSLFAYVPSAGLYHYHAKNLKHLLYKRVRNLNMHYFPNNRSTKYRWLDTSNRRGFLKLILWVIYANLFFPAVIRGFIRFLKYKDKVMLMEPIVTIAVTDVVLWSFIKDQKGRKIIVSSLKAFFQKNKGKSEGAFGL